jgi:small-conductance mechanosensitive channel
VTAPWGPLVLWEWLTVVSVLAASMALGFALQWFVLKLAGRFTRRSPTLWDDRLVQSLSGPLWMVGTALLIHGASLVVELPEVGGLKDLIVRSLTIVGLVWFALRLLKVVTTYVGAREDAPSGRYRSIRTQFEFSRRILEFAIWFVGLAAFLLQFDVVRNVGVSLLASAGIAGVVLGIAAQKSFASLFAGVQLSITQPIRLGDVVVIEKEYGTVEEIRLTYVVVRTWDSRRLIVPIAYFLDKMFENWSLDESPMLSTVVLKLDFLADVDALRTEIDRLLTDERSKAMWDGKTRFVHVTDADERTMTLRVLVSAASPVHAFDLRCLMREGLIRYLRQHPEWLPRVRSDGQPVQALQAPN